MTIKLIKKTKTIFWDFDGVIKDSVLVKSNAFRQLFLPYGKHLAEKIKIHHEENGGMSRYEKLPIYLNWAGESFSQNLINKYEKKFANLVKLKVVESPWVSGVIEYLKKNFKTQQFFIVTATPQKEIEEITQKLKISEYFKQIVGSPKSKKVAIKELINKYSINIDDALMIGDSISDYDAASENQIKFILRKTTFNKKLQKKLECTMIENFLDE